MIRSEFLNKVFIVSRLEEVCEIEHGAHRITLRSLFHRIEMRVRLFFCNAAIFFFRTLWFSSRLKEQNHVSSVVVYMQGTLGDHLVHLPAVAGVRQRFPDATITLVSFYPGFPMEEWLKSISYLNRVIVIDDHPVIRNGFDFRFSDDRLHTLSADLFINFSPFGNRGVPGFVGRELIFAKMVKARRTAGFRMNSYGGSERLNDVQYLFVKNEPQRGAWVLTPLKIQLNVGNDVLPRDISAEQSMREKLLKIWDKKSPIVVVNPGAKFAIKCWPADRFASLTAWLIREFDAVVVVTGIASEKQLGEEIVTASSGRALNLAGETSMLELVELLRMSALCVTNDTGTMHVAALLQTPMVAIFGTRISPTHWFPSSRHARVLFSFMSSSYSFNDKGNADESILRIKVDDVRGAVSEVMRLPYSTPTAN